MKNPTKRSKVALLVLALIMVAGLLPVSAFAAINGTLSSGSVIYTAGQYRYGPSIIMNSDGTADMWTCAPGSGGAWDFIYYRHSTNGGVTWSSDSIALQPTPGARDQFSACDPGAIKFGGYYYIGYTSTEDSRGTDNDVYVARSTSPTGPWEKWNGSGWGGSSPQPFIVFDDPYTDPYGAGEPSLVVKGTTLYIYYTWMTHDASGNSIEQTRVRTASTTDANWPGSTTYQGVAINRVPNNGEDSTDHKYVPSLNKFIAVGTAQRFTPSGYVKIYESTDGITYTLSSTITSGLETKIHNMGISGNELGQLDLSANNFIAYAYGDNWGQWNTYENPITLSTGTITGTTATASSSLSGWAVSRVVDGDTSTNWSSNPSGSAAGTEWVYLDMGSAKTVSNVVLTPRNTGECFPVDFKFQYSNDASTWTDVPGQSYTSYVNPGGASQTFNFASSVTARYIRLYVTKEGADSYGNHYVQMAEFTVNGTTPSATNLALNKTATSNSSLESTDWGVSRATDGIKTSVAGSNGYTSNNFGSANVSASPIRLAVDLGSNQTVNQVKLYPRTNATGVGGGSADFPVNFTIETSTDGSTYTTVSTITGQANPNGSAQTYNFGATTARYVRISATTLGAPASDESSYYRLQLAEFEVYNIAGTGPVNTFVNAGFESPAVSDFQYAPFTSGWNFLNGAGVQHNGGSFNTTSVPDGVQTAFLQNASEMNQSVNFSAGSHTISFSAAKRATYAGTQSFTVYYDSTVIGTFTPSTSTFTTFTTSSFTATAGNHTIRFVGTNASGDNTDLIDHVVVN